MIFEPLGLSGAVLIIPEPAADERGFFARTFSRDEFARHGLTTAYVEESVAHNRRAGTLRGLHYQADPASEVKLVRCERGAVFDVIVDLRPGSATFGQVETVQLDDRSARGLYIPAGFAHGYQSLTDDTLVHYHISAAYEPQLARGIHWEDPDLAISWPLKPSVVSERDRMLPRLRELFPKGIAPSA